MPESVWKPLRKCKPGDAVTRRHCVGAPIRDCLLRAGLGPRKEMSHARNLRGRARRPCAGALAKRRAAG